MQHEPGISGILGACENLRASPGAPAAPSLLDRVSDAVLSTDLELRITSWNKAAEEIYGWSAPEAIGQHVDQLLRARFIDTTPQEAFACLLEHGHVEMAVVHLDRAGREHHIEASVVLTRDAQGQPAGTLGVLRDVSARRQAEANLRANEQRLTLALEGGEMASWEWNLRTMHSLWTAKMYELLGLPPGDGRPASDVFFRQVHPEDAAEVQASLKRAIDSGGPWAHEFRVIWPDGQVHWLAGAGRMLKTSGEKSEVMFGVNYDITARKEAEAVLVRSREELEQLVAQRTAQLQEAVEELEQFSHSITHDMRSPLRTMIGMLAILEEDLGPNVPAAPLDCLNRVRNAARRMDQLITDALLYSRAGKTEMPLAPVDVKALIDGIVHSYPNLQPPLAHIEVTPSMPWVLANEAGLTQCFSNLLGNAVKFVAPGVQPRVRIFHELIDRAPKSRAEAPAAPPARYVRIWVQDNGVGIPAVAQPKLFQLFHRANSQFEGTGVGLALARKVTERMGGRIGFLSQEGQGSHFWVELRRAE